MVIVIEKLLSKQVDLNEMQFFYATAWDQNCYSYLKKVSGEKLIQKESFLLLTCIFGETFRPIFLGIFFGEL